MRGLVPWVIVLCGIAALLWLLVDVGWRASFVAVAAASVPCLVGGAFAINSWIRSRWPWKPAGCKVRDQSRADFISTRNNHHRDIWVAAVSAVVFAPAGARVAYLLGM